MTIPVSNITNEWYDQTNITVQYDDGSTGTLTLVPITNSGSVSMYYDWQAVPGGSVEIDVKDKTAATLTVALPESTFKSQKFTLTAGNVSVKSSELGIGGSGSSSSSSSSSGSSSSSAGDSVYGGITIDGSFDDWSGVTMHGGGQCADRINKSAAVWDGDTFYVYLGESSYGGASMCGLHRNGVFALTSDLGNQLLFQLNWDGSVSGVDGATARHVGSQWEVAIPASALPDYLETFKLSPYTGGDPTDADVLVGDIANLDGSTSGGSFGGGIVIDGSYGDWAYYPHSVMSYTSVGGGNFTPDAHGALYTQDGMLYSHVYTTLPQHVNNDSGAEFLAAVSIAFNGEHNYQGNPKDGNFYPKFFTVDESGKITVVQAGTHLPKGTHTLYISDIRSGFDLEHTNFADLPDSELFGKMMVTIGEGRDEMEFEIDLHKVAAYIGADADDFKLIETQFGMLGQQWVGSAGVSTAPFVGIGLCIAVAAAALLLRRRRSALCTGGSEGNG